MNTTNQTRKYIPTSISAHVHSNTAICCNCGHQHPEASMLPTYPVPGLTVWHCGACQEQLADTPDIKLAKYIAAARTTYLERKGYKFHRGPYFFAVHNRLQKGVAFVNGEFNRGEFQRIEIEAQHIGLASWTVLVNGLVTYTGAGITAIRIHQDEGNQFTVADIQADLMSDVRAGKKSQRP